MAPIILYKASSRTMYASDGRCSRQSMMSWGSLPNAIQADDEMDKAKYQKVAPEELVLARSVQRRASSIDHLLAKVSMLFDPLEQRKEGVPGVRHEFVGSARPDDRLHAGCREACLEISAAHLERPSPFFSLHTHEHLHSLERDVVHCPSWPTSM